MDKYQDMGTEPGMGGGAGGISLRNLKTFSSFKNPVYRIYYGSLFGENLAMNMELVARSLLIYRLTHSAAILGFMSLAQALPMLFLSLFGGVIADRVQKKYVLLVGLSASTLVTLGIALALSLGYLSAEHAGSWWILFVAGLLQGIIFGLIMPSRQTLIRDIVGEEQLMNAVSLNIMGMNALRLFAPAAAGFLIDALGFPTLYYIKTGINFVTVVFIIFLPLTKTTSFRGRGALADIKEGIQYVRQERHILLVLIFTLFAVVLSMPYMTLLPIFTEDILKVGATGMGVLMSVSGIGAIVGSLALASLPNKKRGGMLLVSCLIVGVALAGFAFSNSWSLSLALIVFVGLGQTGRMTLANTLLQYYANDDYRGRVMSIYMMEFGLSSFGSFGAGLLAEAMGVSLAVGGLAVILVFLSVLTLFLVPRLRRLD